MLHMFAERVDEGLLGTDGLVPIHKTIKPNLFCQNGRHSALCDGSNIGPIKVHPDSEESTSHLDKFVFYFGNRDKLETE